jgi:hypothetical protein
VTNDAMPYVLGDELWRFETTDGKTGAVDVVEAHLAMNAIAKQSQEHLSEEGWHLDQFQIWLEANGGPPGLRNAQRDRLWYALREEFVKRRQVQKAGLDEAMGIAPKPADSDDD